MNFSEFDIQLNYNIFCTPKEKSNQFSVRDIYEYKEFVDVKVSTWYDFKQINNTDLRRTNQARICILILQFAWKLPALLSPLPYMGVRMAA